VGTQKINGSDNRANFLKSAKSSMDASAYGEGPRASKHSPQRRRIDTIKKLPTSPLEQSPQNA
jgi:hypothetical protein